MSKTTRKLTTTGVMLALATVLSMIPFFDAPYGGRVTPGSMLPLIILAIQYKTRWGILSGIVFAVLNMVLTGIPAPPVASPGNFILVVLLDYVLAFGGLGLAGGVFRLLPEKPFAVPVATAAAVTFRFLCHFLSGILIWRTFAWEGYSAALYSFLYNGSYMLFELLITTALAALSARWILKTAGLAGDA